MNTFSNLCCFKWCKRTRQVKANSVINNLRYGVKSEVKEIELAYVIDIARSSLSKEEIITDINSKTIINAKGKKPKNTEYTTGLKYDKELSELILKYLD